jgi:hypothetical protein
MGQMRSGALSSGETASDEKRCHTMRYPLRSYARNFLNIADTRSTISKMTTLTQTRMLMPTAAAAMSFIARIFSFSRISIPFASFAA